MKTYKLNRSVQLKGKYFIGDPCYAISDDNDWQELCKLMFPNGVAEFDDSNNIRVVEIEHNNKVYKCYLFGTAYGDGSYPLCKDGDLVDHLGVDAGMLSLIPAELLQKENYGESVHCGVFMDIDEDDMMLVNNGNFTYGSLDINTSGDEEDEYEEEDE